MSQSTTALSRRRPPPKRPPLAFKEIWHNVGFRNWAYQATVVGTVVGLAAYMIGNTQAALETRVECCSQSVIWVACQGMEEQGSTPLFGEVSPELPSVFQAPEV